MKSTQQIWFDFDQARKRADEIDEIAEHVRRVSKDHMEDTLSVLPYGWKGDSANKFTGKARRLQTEISKTDTELNDIADTIRTIARIVYDAEMDAWEVANQRNYGGSIIGGGSGGADIGGGDIEG